MELYWRSDYVRKDQSVNNTEEDFNVETEDNQNDTNIENSVSNTDNSEANASDSENNSEESIKDEESESQDTKIKELEKLANDNEEKYLRLYAEFENYKRRIQKENQINATYKAQGVLTDILPSIDNIERALQIEGDDESFKSLQKGVQMVHESLLRALKDNGLEEILAEGKNSILIYIKLSFKMTILILNQEKLLKNYKKDTNLRIVF